jgi:hypothetical protein
VDHRPDRRAEEPSLPSPTRIIAFGLGLAGALVASQGPEYAQQYRSGSAVRSTSCGPS